MVISLVLERDVVKVKKGCVIGGNIAGEKLSLSRLYLSLRLSPYGICKEFLFLYNQLNYLLTSYIQPLYYTTRYVRGL